MGDSLILSSAPTFCVLGPDGKRRITWAGRSIRQIFQSPEQMVKWMDQAASYYEEQRRKEGLKPEPPLALPLIPTVRLAINTAAADDVPLVVLYGKMQEETSRLKAAAASLAWRPEFVGRCAYACTTLPADLCPLESGTAHPGFLIIQPAGFGLSGRLLARAEPGATPEQLATTLRQALQAFQPRRLKGFEYMRAGQEEGAFWETKLPVTDIQEAWVREQARRRRASPHP